MADQRFDNKSTNHLRKSVVSGTLVGDMPKRTYQPKTRRRARVHGFRARMASKSGRVVLKSRRLKGRTKIAV